MVSLADCSPTTDHQMVVETKAGGSPFATSGEYLKAEGHPGPLVKSATGREQGGELQSGTKPPTCPGPGQGLAQIYLESLGHRVRRQRPGGRGREAKGTSLLKEQEEQTGRVGGGGVGEGAER